MTNDPSTWTIDRLRSELRARRLSVHGTRQELFDRYIAAASGLPVLATGGGGANANSQTGRQPDWSIHESARLIEVMSDPESVSLLLDYEHIPDRAELDVGIADIWADDGWVVVRFNQVRPPDLDYQGQTNGSAALANVDPRIHPHLRSGEYLKGRWSSLKTAFTTAHTNWTASGQNDPDCFWDFVNGRLDLLYMFYAIQHQPALEAFVLRTVPDDFARDEGLPQLERKHVKPADAMDHSRSRKRQRGKEEVAVAPSQVTVTMQLTASADEQQYLRQLQVEATAAARANLTASLQGLMQARSGVDRQQHAALYDQLTQAIEKTIRDLTNV